MRTVFAMATYRVASYPGECGRNRGQIAPSGVIAVLLASSSGLTESPGVGADGLRGDG